MDLWATAATFLGIILLDVVLSGDNAVIVGTLAGSLPDHQRKKAIFYGMSMAVVMRIILSLFATYLITIPYLRFFGGLLLFYVAYGMWNDLSSDGEEESQTVGHRTFASALVAIGLADLSMSIDNILAVAGTANGHWGALIFGLILSIAIMAFAASLVAKLMDKYKWIGWVGFILVIGVGVKLIYEDVPSILALFH